MVCMSNRIRWSDLWSAMREVSMLCLKNVEFVSLPALMDKLFSVSVRVTKIMTRRDSMMESCVYFVFNPHMKDAYLGETTNFESERGTQY